MKRIVQDPSRYHRPIGFSAFRDINPTRLRLFAAVAIEFTSLESMVDFALRELLRLPLDDTNVISRINGLGSKIEIIKSITRNSPTLKGEPAELIASCLGEIAVLKTFRDAVIHADIHDPSATMARSPIKHGKPYEVDLRVTTLRALVIRILGMQREMQSVIGVTGHHFDEIDLETNGYLNAAQVINSVIVQRHFRQLREQHKRRKALPKIATLQDERTPPTAPSRVTPEQAQQLVVPSQPRARQASLAPLP